MVDGVLHLDLEIRQARWYPEAVDGPSVIVPAIAEVGQGPEIPAPLIRVREGTTIAIRLSNPLDTTLMVYGLTTHPSEEGDTLLLGPGETSAHRRPGHRPCAERPRSRHQHLERTR
jgi:FtsP/CotA-like multicopper oxidase with cupredoxin domain